MARNARIKKRFLTCRNFPLKAPPVASGIESSSRRIVSWSTGVFLSEYGSGGFALNVTSVVSTEGLQGARIVGQRWKGRFRACVPALCPSIPSSLPPATIVPTYCVTFEVLMVLSFFLHDHCDKRDEYTYDGNIFLFIIII